jgi:cytochrome c553
MKKAWFGSFLTLVIVAGPAAAGDAALGAQKAVVCAACHGATGSSVNPEWPSLAGQPAPYIVAQLKQFQQGTRVNPLMTPMAAPLSEADMADLAAHYSQQTPAGLEADPSSWKLGERLYRGGDTSVDRYGTRRDIPACIACHGPQGRGNAPAGFPALRAQQSLYAYNQLRAFAAGTRKSTGNTIMQDIASRLTDEEMRALASYTQGLR